MLKTTNKKVKNATTNEFDGIKFKSIAECRAYKLYKEAGLNPVYELDKQVIMQGFKPTVPFYKPIKVGARKTLGVNYTKVIDITYTPDFIIKGTKNTYYIEIKGFRTDSYNIKVKLFRKWLETQPNSVFFELHSMKDVRESIEIIKCYEEDTGTNKAST